MPPSSGTPPSGAGTQATAPLEPAGGTQGVQWVPQVLTSESAAQVEPHRWKPGLQAPLQTVLSVALTQTPLHSFCPEEQTRVMSGTVRSGALRSGALRSSTTDRSGPVPLV